MEEVCKDCGTDCSADVCLSKKVEMCGKGHEKVNGKCPKCGRTPEYTTDEDMIAKVDEYLDSCLDMYDLESKQRKVKLPKLESFSLMLGINGDTLVEWRKQHPEFSAACTKIEQKQKESLIDQGLAGNYNPVIAKLILSANHGMAEKTQTDVTSKGEQIMNVDVLVKAKVDNLLHDVLNPRDTK